MNGTPIDKLRYLQTQQYEGGQQNPMFQTGDNIGDIMDDGRNPITSIAQDINDTIDDITTPEPPQRPQKIVKSVPKEKDGLMTKIPKFFREPIILILIYILLSTDIVKKTLSTYIPQIKPTTDGNILFVGILIYSIILAFSFVVAKKALL